MKAKLSEKQMHCDKRLTHIVTPVNEDEYKIFTKVIREYHHDSFARFIRQMVIREYNELVEKGRIAE